MFAYLLALAGTLFLGAESTRLAGVVLVVAGALLAVLAWGGNAGFLLFLRSFRTRSATGD